MNEKDFYQQYQTTKEELADINLSFEKLLAIKQDFESRKSSFDNYGLLLLQELNHAADVHLLNYRVKSPDHLVKKIIRKRKEGKFEKIDRGNYKKLISDLVGLRIIHIFKDEWKKIDDYIRKEFTLNEDPIFYYRKGDAENFSSSQFKMQEHPFGYRSLHYVVNARPKKEEILAEIQVRTILEEAWGEMDHSVRYPDFSDDPLIAEYSMTINRMIGTVDEMALNLKKQKIELDNLKNKFQNDEKAMTRLKNEHENLSSLAGDGLTIGGLSWLIKKMNE